ncbi:MAG TPA: SDR family NAD(P)-dependent oxidoreductase [Polyangiaceae bacterium]|nr:SDR family NAD(P)-dependent oxidoreductase [Polyangiaceae bacterium]
MTASRKLMVTGGAGFIGCVLSHRLLEDGHDVVVLDNMKRSTAKVVDRLARAGARVVTADVRDYDAVLAAARGCETVFHLAAQSNVMGAIEDPNYSVTTNVLGTFNVLRAAAEADVGRVVFTSSREVYGEATTLPVREDHPLLAKNPYGASKVAGEAYCRTFANTHKLPVRVVRFANVYGPGDSGRVIPLWLTAAHEGRDIQVYGGEQIIDFLWVGTAVDALLYAEEHDLPGPVNIGSGRGTKIMDLAESVLRVTGASVRVVRTPAREIEVAKFVADVAVMRSLGLSPEEDPLQHLAELVEAYRPS